MQLIKVNHDASFFSRKQYSLESVSTRRRLMDVGVPSGTTACWLSDAVSGMLIGVSGDQLAGIFFCLKGLNMH
jgi:hypothetical protein